LRTWFCGQKAELAACLSHGLSFTSEEASEATSSFAFVRQLTSSFVPAQSDVFFFEIGGNGEEQRTL
jgi:hypothetical protein